MSKWRAGPSAAAPGHAQDSGEKPSVRGGKKKAGGTGGNLNEAALSEDVTRGAACDPSNLPCEILSSAVSKFLKQEGSLGFAFRFIF